MNKLLQIVEHHTAPYAADGNVFDTALPEVSLVRATAPGGLVHAISRPLACLVLQGRKRVTAGSTSVEFGAGESLLITAHVPTVSQITEATDEAPYCSIVFALDPAVISEVGVEMDHDPAANASPVQSEATGAEVADVAWRLLRLLDRPNGISVLYTAYIRELHYWLLVGRHGRAVRKLGALNSGPRQGIARTISLLREQFAEKISMDSLATNAGMSLSSFHQQFRAATALTPLQFQKQLRLIEAKRLMLSDGRNASAAAYQVGYESVHQFSREYTRLFGAPPMRDVEATKVLDYSFAAKAEESLLQLNV